VSICRHDGASVIVGVCRERLAFLGGGRGCQRGAELRVLKKLFLPFLDRRFL